MGLKLLPFLLQTDGRTVMKILLITYIFHAWHSETHLLINHHITRLLINHFEFSRELKRKRDRFGKPGVE